MTVADGADTLLADGGVAQLSIPVGPVRVSWTARHTGYQPGRQFIDTMERGPFPHWVHTHQFELAPGGCTLIDHIDYDLGAAGLVVGRRMARDLDRLFSFRCRRSPKSVRFQRHPPLATTQVDDIRLPRPVLLPSPFSRCALLSFLVHEAAVDDATFEQVQIKRALRDRNRKDGKGNGQNRLNMGEGCSPRGSGAEPAAARSGCGRAATEPTRPTCTTAPPGRRTQPRVPGSRSGWRSWTSW